MSYQDYLGGEHWDRIRRRKLEAADWMCERWVQRAARELLTEVDEM